jgi:pimeloyl-ACP methyl ester carboxylesterase
LLDAVEFQERKFAKPTLLISGKNSGYIKPGDIEQFKDVFPDFKHFELDSGHWVHVEQADKFMEILVSFLNKN